MHLHDRLLDDLDDLNPEVSLHASTPPNPLKGYQQALSDPPDCTHLLVIQDDTIVCKNFPLAVKRIAESKSDVPICLFLSRLPVPEAKAAIQALGRGVRYISVRPRMNSFIPVVAVLWPLTKAEHFREWSKVAVLPGYPKREPASDDAALARWSIKNKERVLMTVPSLVEHPDNVPSVIGRRAKWGRDRGRVALSYIGEDDPLLLDWS